MRIFLLTATLGLLAPLSCYGTTHTNDESKYFDFNAGCRDAYQKAMSIRFGEAGAQLEALKRNEPNNLIPLFVENYIEFLTIFINDNESDYKRLRRRMEPRLDAVSRGDRRSPYYLYCQAEIRLQWAILRGKFGDYLSSLSDIKQAYALLEENQRRFPDFVANKKSLGVMHALVGNIPEEYRWALKTLGGLNGTIEQGLSEIESVIQYARKDQQFVFGEEALVAYAFLQLHLNNQGESAWKILNSGSLNHRENPLAAMTLANMAIRSGRNDEAVKILTECPSGGPYHPFLYRHFMLGLAKLYRLDGDANQHLETFVYQFKGSYAVKEAWQKLAWYHLINGNQQGYRDHIYNAKVKGNSRAETDKAAEREAQSGEMPDPLLTKARLLFDGGYYARAYDMLKNAAGYYTGNPKHLIEYNYRMGRICHKYGKSREALSFYGEAMEKGADKPWYFACGAALQMGTVYEDQKEWAKARSAFQRCIAIKPEEYGAGLHAKAKAGLNRLKGK